MALAYQALGCREDAETVAAALQEFCVERGLADLSDLDSTQARLALLRGDTGRALAMVDRSRGTTATQSMIAYETATLTRAMVHHSYRSALKISMPEA